MPDEFEKYSFVNLNFVLFHLIVPRLQRYPPKRSVYQCIHHMLIDIIHIPPGFF
jgi:hypothetical protein